MVRRLHARGYALRVFDIVAAKTAAAAVGAFGPHLAGRCGRGRRCRRPQSPDDQAVEAAVFGPMVSRPA